MSQNNLEAQIIASLRDVPDFPKPGIIFKDITPLLSDVALLDDCIAELAQRIGQFQPDAIVGIEARGFIFGALLASKMRLPFVPIRKPGKLPWKTKKIDYSLEYGTGSIEIHEDALQAGQKVVIVDDLLATGGTCQASVQLIESLQAQVVASAFIIELGFLEGRKILEKTAPVLALTTL